MNHSSQDPVPTSVRRKKVLLALLVVMLVMLVYDYRVARPSVDRAYQQISERTVAVNDSPDRSLTNVNVQSLITKSPSRTFLDGDDLVEVYSWQSGLPLRTHDLFAVYKESKRGEQVFYRHAKYVYETSAEVAPVPVPMRVRGTPEELAQYDIEMAKERQADYDEAMSELSIEQADQDPQPVRAQ